MRISRLLAVTAGIAAVAAAAAGSGVGHSGAQYAGAGIADVAVQPGVQHVGRVRQSPPTTASCRRDYKVACYQPRQIQQAHDLPAPSSFRIISRPAIKTFEPNELSCDL